MLTVLSAKSLVSTSTQGIDTSVLAHLPQKICSQNIKHEYHLVNKRVKNRESKNA